jgi:hypothetical protein
LKRGRTHPKESWDILINVSEKPIIGLRLCLGDLGEGQESGGFVVELYCQRRVYEYFNLILLGRNTRMRIKL